MMVALTREAGRPLHLVLTSTVLSSEATSRWVRHALRSRSCLQAQRRKCDPGRNT